MHEIGRQRVMEDRCGIINNGMHTCDVEKTEIILGNSASFELDKKIEPFGCLLNYLCDMRVPS